MDIVSIFADQKVASLERGTSQHELLPKFLVLAQVLEEDETKHAEGRVQNHSNSRDGLMSSPLAPAALKDATRVPSVTSGTWTRARKLQIDARIQLEPITTPAILSPRKSTELMLPPSTVELLTSDNDRMMKQTLAFYRALASLKLREIVKSEAMFLKTISSILVTTCHALQADVVSLYAFDESNQQLTISSSSKPGLAGFQVPLDKFALRKVVLHGSAMPAFVTNLQQSDQFDAKSDLDTQSGMTTVSVVANAIWDERGKPAFVLEARSTRDVMFSFSMFGAALISIDNAVCQYDLNQELVKKQNEYDELDVVLRHTLEPVGTNANSGNDSAVVAAPETPQAALPLSQHETPFQQQALEALLSPDINELLHNLAHVASFESCYLLSMKEENGEVVVSKTPCGLALLSSNTDSFDINKLLEVKTARSSDGTSLSAAAEDFRASFMNSVDQCEPVDLSQDQQVRDCFVDQTRIGCVVMFPLPRGCNSSSWSGYYYGVLGMTSNRSHDYDLRTLKPFLSALSLANVIVKKNQDMKASTHQKDRLISLYNAHFAVDNISDPSVLVNMICNIGSDIFDTKRVTLYVADPIKKELWSLSNLGSVNGLRIPYGTGIAGTCALTCERLIVRDPYHDARFDPSFDIKLGFRTESLMTFPVLDRNGEGEVLGVIQAVNSRSLQLESTKLKYNRDLILLFEAKVMDVYNHMVAYALRVNSSLIMFAKVQSDYHIAHHMDSSSDDGHGTPRSGVASEVATVHSLLDVHGFDETKRVTRGPWITFAFLCACVGRFMVHLKEIRQSHLACSTPRNEHDNPNETLAAHSDPSSSSRRPARRSATEFASSTSRPRRGRRRMNMPYNETALRTSSLVSRWRHNSEGFASLSDDICSLEFDVMSKSSLELVEFSVRLFDGLSLIDTFHIDQAVLRTFIMNLASRYRQVPYHGFLHGFDVAQSCFVLVRRTRIFEIIKEYEALCLIIAGLGHDADHPGNDNQFEIDTSSPLALCYNDMSVLENHHAATTFEVLRQEDCNILKDLSTMVRATIRGVVVRCILATDMKNHSKHLSELALVSNINAFETITDGRQLMLNTIIHCSDLGSMARPLRIALQWVDRVCQEFSDQAKKSEELGINVPKHLQNLESEKPRAILQVNFISYVVLPLWNSVMVILPEVKTQIDYLTQCHNYYTSMLKRNSEESSQ